METTDAIRALAALAQETRLEIYRLLVQAGPDGRAAGVLAEAIRTPGTTLSFHLAQMVNAGLVTQRRAGRSIIYATDFNRMNGLLVFLMENCCGNSVAACGTSSCGPDTSFREEVHHEAAARSRRRRRAC